MPRRIGLLFFILVCASTMCAGAVFNFESYSASAGGTALNGQGSWYLPPIGGITPNVYPYAGNLLGISTNPQGGLQFAAGLSAGSPSPARGQNNVSFGASTLWTVTADIAVLGSSGSEVASTPAGGFSLQTTAGGISSFNSGAIWDGSSAGSTWSLGYYYYDAAGTGLGPVAPGSAWLGLPQNHWYREGMVIDLAANRVLEVSIQDLAGGSPTVYNPADWYLYNGSGGVSGTDAIRLFAGNNAGNIFALDNVSIQEGAVPEPATLLTFSGGILLLLAIARRRKAV